MKKNEATRYRMIRQVNAQNNPDRKPFSDVPFSHLRRMAVVYPIARACINRRIRQATQLSYEVTTVPEIDGEKGYEAQIKNVKAFLKHPMGHKTRFREFLSILVDDILTIDATCFEIARLRNTTLDVSRGLVPVDPSTIVLRVTETGGTPIPPAIAYAQIIQGQVIGEFTTDEMMYESLSSRSYSPYGLAPLESLILQAEAAIRGTLYNLNYFRENNVPEGFITLPEEVATTQDQVEEWQQWFDAIVAGDNRMVHRLKILPNGSEYTPAKKPEDMAFERFELWLLQQTCAVFDVPPQDIGITYQVNKATGETQSELSRERGLIPLTNFIKEIMDDIIQSLLGFENLQFIWTNVNPVDRKEEIDIASEELKLGALSIDEYRQEQGREPLGVGHMVWIGDRLIPIEAVVSGEAFQQQQQTGDEEKKPTKDERKEDEEEDEAKKYEQELKDIKKWRTCIYRDLEMGKPLRKDFDSRYIRDDIKKSIQFGLKEVFSHEQAKALFNEFLDPEIRASMKLLQVARQMRGLENADITNNTT